VKRVLLAGVAELFHFQLGSHFFRLVGKVIGYLANGALQLRK
jgi:hypothetical protein